MWENQFNLFLVLHISFIGSLAANLHGIQRVKCQNHGRIQIYDTQENILHQRLLALRHEMTVRASVQNSEIDAYIVTSFDEHLSEMVSSSDQRLKFLTGFSGALGDAVITLKAAALWTDGRYYDLADSELNCNWKIFKMGEQPTIGEWLTKELAPESRIGTDPQLIPHHTWSLLEKELSKEYLKLVKVHKNLIDLVWGNVRPAPSKASIKIQPLRYAGEPWEKKISVLREQLAVMKCDAIVVTSLTEIAYILNLRGNDIPYTPVFKSYLILTANDILLYFNRSKADIGVIHHLKAHQCHHTNCVQIKHYHEFWRDLRTLPQQWSKVLVPGQIAFDMGASEAVFSALPRAIVYERVSPIIFMRVKKNDIERQGMRKAHIRDGAAMCEILSFLEDRFVAGDNWTEISLAREIDKSRKIQDLSEGISFKTMVAFGPHSSLPHYTPTNKTDIEITEYNTLLIDSGGQYSDGTTDVSRTIHLGKPTAEQKIAYTNVLAGLIRLSMLDFPENLKSAKLDAFARGPMWRAMNDYPHDTGHGIGSFLSVHESPISIAYTTKQEYRFKEGYFFSIEPGYYKPGEFGIRLENVLEVVDTGNKHFSGDKFFAFQDVTLVPFETNLIDKSLLSAQEKKWLNIYNARIREFVGYELKKKQKNQAFYWMMNKTKHITEYLPESEYRSGSETLPKSWNFYAAIVTTILYIYSV